MTNLPLQDLRPQKLGKRRGSKVLYAKNRWVVLLTTRSSVQVWFDPASFQCLRCAWLGSVRSFQNAGSVAASGLTPPERRARSPNRSSGHCCWPCRKKVRFSTNFLVRTKTSFLDKSVFGNKSRQKKTHFSRQAVIKLLQINPVRSPSILAGQTCEAKAER